ncbi:MAG TPA: ABATE domain-containing protein [Steroidobacteraceae bacterium]
MRRAVSLKGRTRVALERKAQSDNLGSRANGSATASRPPALFIADALGLDFLNSIARPVDEVVEWIGCGEDLLAWLAQAKLVPDEVLTTLRVNALPGELDAAAAQARALRDWFRGFVEAHRGKPLRSNALAQLEPLNKVLARDEEFGRIVVRPRGQAHEGKSDLEWQALRRWRSPDTLLLPIARTLAELVCEEDFTRVKGCEGMGCILFFVDRTNSGARRWCNMAICGNRAKQSALRERLQRGRKRRG